MIWKAGSSNVSLLVGDITEVKVDAIVNAANSSLLGGGGVDGAIHRKAGPELLEECRRIDGCPTGEARLTAAYNLPSKFVIHTVGPVFRDGNSGEAQLLSSCYRSSLELAEYHNVKSIAFPAISTGVYGYPMKEAAIISLRTIKEYLQKDSAIEFVKIVLYRASYESLYRKCGEGVF